MQVKSLLTTSLLLANGTYNATSWVGWPSIKINLDSKGEQKFEAKLVNARFEPVMNIDIEAGCDDGNAVITEMSAPLLYDDIAFYSGDDNHIADTATAGALTLLIETQNLAVAASIRKLMHSTISQIIC